MLEAQRVLDVLGRLELRRGPVGNVQLRKVSVPRRLRRLLSGKVTLGKPWS